MLTPQQLKLIEEFNISVQSVEDSLIAITPVDLKKTVEEKADLDYAYDYPQYFSNGLPATTLEGDNAETFAEILVDEDVWLTDIAFDDLERCLKRLLTSLLINKVLDDKGYKVTATLYEGNKAVPAKLFNIGNPTWVRVVADGNFIWPANFTTLTLKSPTGGVIEHDNHSVEEFYEVLGKQALALEPTLLDEVSE